MRTQDPTKAALSDLTVVEYGQFAAAPYCAKLLADMGATVIKVEDPVRGDEARRRGPFPEDTPHPERSGLFLYLNTNKLGTTLSMRSAAGRKLFSELVKIADVCIHDQNPQQAQALGLDYESLRRVNSGLVVTAITPFGQDGPYRDYEADDLIETHLGGLAYGTPGFPDYALDPEKEPPLRPGTPAADLISGVVAAVATLFALFARMKDGRGRLVDISRHEAVVAASMYDVSHYSYTGILGGRTIYRLHAAPNSYLPCKDGYVAFVAATERQWQALVEIMGNPEWALDPRFKDGYARRDNWETLKPHLLRWTMAHTGDEIRRLCQPRKVPCFPALTLREAVESEHLAARGFIVETDHPKAGRLRYPGPPYRFSVSPWSLRRPAPLLGEHNEEVYCRRLGYSREDLARLRGMGAI